MMNPAISLGGTSTTKTIPGLNLNSLRRSDVLCENAATFSAGDQVEVQGSAVLGKEYDGSWHAATIIHSTARNTGARLYYDLELHELSPRTRDKQFVTSIRAAAVRPIPRTAKHRSMRQLEPGTVLEHTLPQTPNCWWLGVLLKKENGTAVIVNPANHHAEPYTVNSTSQFRPAMHWDGKVQQWLSAWRIPYAKNFQTCLEGHFNRLQGPEGTAPQAKLHYADNSITPNSARTVRPRTPRISTPGNLDSPRRSQRTPRGGSHLNSARGPSKLHNCNSILADGNVEAPRADGGPETPRDDDVLETPRKRQRIAQTGAGICAESPVQGAFGVANIPSRSPRRRLSWSRNEDMASKTPRWSTALSAAPLKPDTPRQEDEMVYGKKEADATTGVPSPVTYAPAFKSSSGSASEKLLARESSELSLAAATPSILMAISKEAPCSSTAADCVGGQLQTCPSNDLLACEGSEGHRIRNELIAAAEAGANVYMGDLGDVAGDWAETACSLKHDSDAHGAALGLIHMMQTAAAGE